MRSSIPASPERDSARTWGAVRVGAVPELKARDLARLPPDERSPLRFMTEFPSGAYASVLRHACWDVLDSGARQVVAVSSAQRREGATTTAMAIAAISASMKRKTVLVDCDLRARTATLALGHDPPLGVWEVAQGQLTTHQAQILADPFGFCLMPAARAENMVRDLYSGAGAQRLMQELRENFECVVLDLPPVFATVDAAIMARSADVCVLVARRHRTDAAKARRAFRQLRMRTPVPMAILQNFSPVARIGA